MKRPRLESLLSPGALRTFFQPVVELAGARVHYVEALTRGPENTSFERADVLFDYARLCRSEALVDRACVAAVCAAARRLPARTHFGLNVHASTLASDPDFLAHLSDNLLLRDIEPERLVVEIVEHAPRFSGPLLAEALDSLRRIGVRLALDDVGSGESNYRMMLEVQPDYLKLDRVIVQGCDADDRRAAVIESLVLLGRRFGARVVAEGVETAPELLAIERLGVGLVQGYLLGVAAPLDPAPLAEAVAAKGVTRSSANPS
ncbi:MAG: EAL domain-containing protein [Vicinamibacteria bacterium]|nr:EAL domain-containing protein [Vicinamibacteria bacterium]